MLLAGGVVSNITCFMVDRTSDPGPQKVLLAFNSPFIFAAYFTPLSEWSIEQ